MQCLKLTNDYRASKGKPPLRWDTQLHEIAMTHSIDMANKKVPLGHRGFKKRSQMLSFPTRGFRENVAYNHGYENPAKTAVDGWIDSPGHRRNLLSESTLCSIAVVEKDSKFYFT